MNRGSLTVYDNVTGKIYYHAGDAQGDVEPHEIPNLPYILTEYGDLDGKRVLSVDVSTTPHSLITEDIPLTEEELEEERILTLEQSILEISSIIAGGGA